MYNSSFSHHAHLNTLASSRDVRPTIKITFALAPVLNRRQNIRLSLLPSRFPRCCGATPAFSLLCLLSRLYSFLTRQLHGGLQPLPISGARPFPLLWGHAHLLSYLSDLFLQLYGFVLSSGHMVRHGQVVHGHKDVEVFRPVQLFSAYATTRRGYKWRRRRGKVGLHRGTLVQRLGQHERDYCVR